MKRMIRLDAITIDLVTGAEVSVVCIVDAYLNLAYAMKPDL